VYVCVQWFFLDPLQTLAIMHQLNEVNTVLQNAKACQVLFGVLSIKGGFVMTSIMRKGKKGSY
jgi:hypothetical protein